MASTRETVTVVLRVPEQFFEYEYEKDAWDKAVEKDEVEYLTDWFISTVDVEDELYGPDGHQLW